MYLKERVLALLIYVFLLLLIMTLIKRIKGVNATLNLYIIALSIMGYFYKPLEGADLTRVTIAMNSYKYLTIPQIIENSKTSIAPLSSLYYYAIGQLNNDNLLPAITAFITFTFIFKIIKSHYCNYITSKKSIALALLFFMSRGLFLQTISNIRTMLSLSILAYCIYKTLYEGKTIIAYLPLLLISSMLHVVGLAAVLIYLFYYFIINNNKYKIRNIFYLLLALILIIKYGKDNIIGAIELGNIYVDSYRLGVGYFYIWEFILSLLVILSTIYIFKKYIIINSTNIYGDLLESHVNFLKFIKFLSIINFITFIFEFNIGLRLNYLLTILNIPFILFILNSKKINQEDQRHIKNYIFIFSFILMFISCTRGDLCGLKF